MRRKLGTAKLVIISAAVLLLCALTYTVLLPEYYASRYINNVHRFAHELQDGYTRLEKSSSRDLLNDPTIQTNKITSEVETVRDLLRENRINLIKFSSQTGGFETLPFTGYTRQARIATALQKRTVAFVDQSEDALNRYDELITFMKDYHSAAAAIEKHTAEFNSKTDLNVYAGQSANVREIAAQIRSEAKAFENTPTPHEVQEFKKASVQTFTEIADGFDMFANGLSIPADSVIYTAAARIERADQQLSNQNQAIFSQEVLSSRTIKTIEELREKLELVTS